MTDPGQLFVVVTFMIAAYFATELSAHAGGWIIGLITGMALAPFTDIKWFDWLIVGWSCCMFLRLTFLVKWRKTK